MSLDEFIIDEFEFSRWLKALPDAATAASTSYGYAMSPDPFAAPASAVIVGTVGPDFLLGTRNADTIDSGDGRDYIQARGGNDNVLAGRGSDTVFAGSGDDTVFGGAGRDIILDGDGNDTISGGQHSDLFILGDGLNTLRDFTAGVDTIMAPNFALSQVNVTQLANGNVVVSFSGSSTVILNASAADVTAALQEQQYGFVQINEDGWGDSQQVYAWAQEVYDGYLYVSTLNVDGTQGSPDIEGAAGLYRYDGTTKEWETISVDGLGNVENDGIRNLLDFNGVLYAGTLNTAEGAELLRSFDGITFETVFDGGNGTPGLGAVRALYEYDGAMYVGLQSLEDGQALKLFRTTDGQTFDEITLPGMEREDYANNNSLHTLTEFDGFLYAATRNPTNGFELYRSADGITFETVIGPGADIGSGITGNQNTLIYHMIEFNGALYLGTGNYSQGFGVFRSFDGVSFEQVGEYGFGDDGNNFAWRFHVFEDELYLGTNFDGEGFGGGNIFRTSDGDVWEELVGVNGIYDDPGINDTTNWGIRSFETYQDSLFVGTANFPYFAEGVDDAVGAQVFEFLGDPEPGTPDYLF